MQRCRLPLSVPSVLRVLVLGAVGVGIAIPATSTGAPKSVPGGAEDVQPAAELPGDELEALRTRTSSTYRTERGERVTRVFGQSVNYRDGQGRWQKIDRKMSPSADGFESGPNRFGLRVPRELAGGLVRVTENGRSFGFGLRQAKGAGAANGAAVRFDDALPGVDVTYEAGADAVKETLELAGPQAQSTFEFPLELSAGLRPRVTQAGGVDVIDGRGDSVFSVHPPVMWDSAPQRAVSNALRYELAGGPGSWVLRLVVDRSWLAAPERRFPVTVDPTVSVGASPNCFVASTFPNGDFCPVSYLLVGQGSGGRVNRSLLKFDLSAIENDALVLGADLALRNDSGGPRAVDAHRLTRSWTDNTTWNKYDGVNNWTTAGGDFDAAVADQNAAVGGGAGWEHWYVPDLVQKWVDGSVANHGVLLKAANEGSAGDLGFSSSSGSYPPYLEVRWTERLGLERQFSFESQQLSDRLDLNVNIANGNLILRERDLQLAGTGMDLVVERFYNSLADFGGAAGYGWWYGTSRDVVVEESDGGKSVLFYGPRSELVRFQRNANGSYRSPTAIDATLEKNSGTGEYTLTYTKTLIKLHFDANGLLQRQTDRNNNEISFDYNTSPPGRVAPGTITDTQDRDIDFTVNNESRVETMTDSDGREWNFDYQAVGGDPTKALDDYTNPDGKLTDYDWDGSQIGEITLPGGDVVKLDYDGQGRIDEIIRVTNSYDYDPLGRLKRAHEVSNGGSGTTVDDREWEYDTASNRTEQTVNGTVTSYGYNAANELCWQSSGTASSYDCTPAPSGATTYTHDANGNMTASSTGLSLSYNIRDQTTSWTPPGGSATSFGYGGLNQTDRTSVGGTAQHNTLLGLSRQGATEWIRDPNGTLVAQNADGTRHYYLGDRLGSTVGLTDAIGALAQTYKYDPYGLDRTSTGTVSNPFQFTGEYRHPASTNSFYKIGARYYWPGAGRWTQQDPIDQGADLRNGNRFAYAGSDPVNLVDPSGTFPSLSEVVETVNDISRDVSETLKVFNESPAGRVVRNCTVGGTAGVIVGWAWKIRKELFVIGCAGVNLVRKGK